MRSERERNGAGLLADGMKGEGRARARPGPDCWARERKEWAAQGEKKRGRGVLGCGVLGWGFFISFLFYFPKPFQNRILNANNFKPEANNTK